MLSKGCIPAIAGLGCTRYHQGGNEFRALHRRILLFIPVILLALYVQVLAPIASTVAMSDAAAVSVIDASICGHAGSDQQPASPTDHHPDGCCVLCGLAHALAAPDDGPSAVRIVARTWTLLAFSLPIRENRPASRLGLSGYPRAPPQA